jgi:hypothetical protein
MCVVILLQCCQFHGCRCVESKQLRPRMVSHTHTTYIQIPLWTCICFAAVAMTRARQPTHTYIHTHRHTHILYSIHITPHRAPLTRASLANRVPDHARSCLRAVCLHRSAPGSHPAQWAPCPPGSACCMTSCVVSAKLLSVHAASTGSPFPATPGWPVGSYVVVRRKRQQKQGISHTDVILTGETEHQLNKTVKR